jgi:hypothetical protein
MKKIEILQTIWIDGVCFQAGHTCDPLKIPAGTLNSILRVGYAQLIEVVEPQPQPQPTPAPAPAKPKK